MTIKAIIISIAAGLASALCVMASFGVGAGASFLILIAPLPIYLATLSQGTAVGVGSSILAIMIAATAISPHVAIGLGFAFTIPASIIANQANLAQETNGEMEWYPLSKLFFNLSIVLSLGISALAIMSGFNTQGLAQELTAAMEKAFEASTRPAPMSKEELDSFIQLSIKILPFVMGSFWLIIHVANIHVAASICRASNMMPRPKDDIAKTISLPKTAMAIMLASLVATLMLSGMIQIISMIIAGTFVTAFTLIGLSILHLKLRNNSAGGVLLTLTYILILITYPLFHLLSVIGIIKVINQSNNQTNIPPNAG